MNAADRESCLGAYGNITAKKRADALRTLIEVGGLDRELMLDLRNQFLAITPREKAHEQAL